jgi:Creatinase/Prolidase N-terminal domain
MKRGLVVLDPAEIPGREWRDRVLALQRRIRAERIDVALIYGDVSRSDDISYLTNLCIYWNEGVLAVPADADPVFLTKLSPRVHPWMRRTSTVSEIHSGRSFGALTANLLAGRRASAVGLIDARLWPSAVIDEISAALPGWQLRRLQGFVREQRLIPSEHELALLRRGAAVIAGGAEAAVRAGPAASARLGAIERELRGAGFLDLAARTTTTADGTISLQVIGQYRNLWLQVGRLAAADGDAGWPVALRQALGSAIGVAADGVSAARLTAAAEPSLRRLPRDTTCEIRWINQADLATCGEYESYPADLPMTRGSVVAITAEAQFADGKSAAVAETVLIGADGAQSLTRGSGPSGAGVSPGGTVSPQASTAGGAMPSGGSAR